MSASQQLFPVIMAELNTAYQDIGHGCFLSSLHACPLKRVCGENT